MGQILKALRSYRLEDRTLVVFTSDNGPWLLYGNHAGHARPLREGKATVFEGGVRVPCLMRWPGRIPKGRVCSEFATTMDLLPTLAALAGASLPADRIIDGKDVWPLTAGQTGAKSSHEAFYYYWDRHLQAVRSGQWKLHFPHDYPRPEPPGADGRPGQYASRRIGQELFDFETDPSETADLAARYPAIVNRLRELAERAREDLGDSAVGRTGKNLRPAGRLGEL